MTEEATTKKTSVEKVIVSDDDIGQRIDNFLIKRFKDLPKSRIYRIIRRGEVRVNSGRIKSSYKIKAGDVLRIPPVTIRSNAGKPSKSYAENILTSILFEDKDLLVIDKPTGVAVHGGSGINFGAIELMRAARPDLYNLSLAHRIDRETSGCLVMTKKRSMLRFLHEKFRTGKIVKNYLALVKGNWQFASNIIDAPLHVQNRENGERHVRVDDAGKASKTKVKLINQYKGFALIRCQPVTGRTHQIRVHLNHIGFPIIGDDRYGVKSQNASKSKKRSRKLYLHAQSLSFSDANDNERIFVAPTPSEFEFFSLK
jgi:23S rRNA pseudouridine955/2504/2580 synthase|tara:strand:+ start:80 stop:1018 length:939 start_codon:yes stop_codon:yes gene_type:complete